MLSPEGASQFKAPEENFESFRVVTDDELKDFSRIDFEVLLGPGFTNEFMGNKLSMYPRKKIVDGWNDYLEIEGNNQEIPPIDEGWLIELFRKIPGLDDTNYMFPIFVQYLQSYYSNQGLLDEVVTPERVQHFFNYMEGMHSQARIL